MGARPGSSQVLRHSIYSNSSMTLQEVLISLKDDILAFIVTTLNLIESLLREYGLLDGNSDKNYTPEKKAKVVYEKLENGTVGDCNNFLLVLKARESVDGESANLLRKISLREGENREVTPSESPTTTDDENRHIKLTASANPRIQLEMGSKYTSQLVGGQSLDVVYHRGAGPLVGQIPSRDDYSEIEDYLLFRLSQLLRSYSDGEDLMKDPIPTFLRDTSVHWSLDNFPARLFQKMTFVPKPLCAITVVGYLKRGIRANIHKKLYNYSKTNPKRARKITEKFLVNNTIPLDLRILMVDAGVSCRIADERMILLLQRALELIDTPDCVNKTILGCAIHSHLAKILWYRGDMEKAQKHASIGYQLALMIDDISALDSFWVSGWLLFSENRGRPTMKQSESEVLSLYNKGHGLIQKLEKESWFRKYAESFKLGKADTNLRFAKNRIDEIESEETTSKNPSANSKVQDLLCTAEDTLKSIDYPMISEQSHCLKDRFVYAFYNHLWFTLYFLKGDFEKAKPFMQIAYDNWMKSGGKEFAEEIADMVRTSGGKLVIS